MGVRETYLIITEPKQRQFTLCSSGAYLDISKDGGGGGYSKSIEKIIHTKLITLRKYI